MYGWAEASGSPSGTARGTNGPEKHDPGPEQIKGLGQATFTLAWSAS